MIYMPNVLTEVSSLTIASEARTIPATSQGTGPNRITCRASSLQGGTLRGSSSAFGQPWASESPEPHKSLNPESPSQKSLTLGIRIFVCIIHLAGLSRIPPPPPPPPGIRSALPGTTSCISRSSLLSVPQLQAARALRERTPKLKMRCW